MKIDFQETTNDLLTRIDIHTKYGGRDIDQWMLDLLQLTPGLKILDVGCGAGKQCLSFYHHLDGQAKITGGDVSSDLLDQARAESARQNAAIDYIPLDFNTRFPLDSDQFDLASCCFAIYYAQDIPFTIQEMHRVLRPGGRLFTTGPMPTNKQVFYDIIREATDRPIPPMPGSSRYGFAILDTIRSLFSSTRVEVFENPLTFTSPEPFIAYTRASLSEDRRLWTSMFTGKEEFEALMEKIKVVVESRIQAEGSIVMTKVVGGFIATK